MTTLSAAGYRATLQDKLREEIAEPDTVQTTDAVVEEAADVLEVLTAIVAGHGATLDSIIDVAQRKRAKRGGFDMRLSLDGVDPASP